MTQPIVPPVFRTGNPVIDRNLDAIAEAFRRLGLTSSGTGDHKVIVDATDTAGTAEEKIVGDGTATVTKTGGSGNRQLTISAVGDHLVKAKNDDTTAVGGLLEKTVADGGTVLGTDVVGGVRKLKIYSPPASTPFPGFYESDPEPDGLADPGDSATAAHGNHVHPSSIHGPVKAFCGAEVALSGWTEGPTGTWTCDAVGTRSGTSWADDATLLNDDRIFLCDRVPGMTTVYDVQAGVYRIVNVGTPSEHAVITRADDMDTSDEFQFGMSVTVLGGTEWGGTTWYLDSYNVIVDTTTQYWNRTTKEVAQPHNDTTGKQGGDATADEFYHLPNYRIPHGWPLDASGNRLVSISYSAATQKITVLANGGAPTFDVWVQGVKFTYDSPYVSDAHDATEGPWYLAHDDTEFAWSADFWNLHEVAPTAYVYYSSEGSTSVGFYELHGWNRDLGWHIETHLTEGTKLISGGVLADYTPDTDTDVAIQFSISEAVIADEDIRRTLAEKSDGTDYTIWYRSGTSGYWTWSTGNALPFLYGTYPQLNYDAGGATGWTLGDISGLGLGTYVTAYVIATTALHSDHRFIIIPGQTQHTTLAAAQGETATALSLGTIPFAEFVPIAQLVFRARSTYGGTAKAQLASVTRLTGGRGSFTSTAISSVHNSLTGLQGGNTGEYYHATSAENALLAAMAIAGGTGLASATVYTSGTGATHTFTTTAKTALLIGQGGGGGGGGVSGSAGNSAAGGGGGSGGYFIAFITIAATTCTYTVGTGGTAGTSGGGTGGTGNDTTITHNGTTYTAKGGTGGVGMTAGTAVNAVAGGIYAGAGTNGTINYVGLPGNPGIRLSGTVAVAGAGGASHWCGGGRFLVNVSNAGYKLDGGGGGGGACSVATSQAGAAGGDGFVCILESF